MHGHIKTLPYFIEKHGKLNGYRKWKEQARKYFKVKQKQAYSKVSQRLFKKLLNFITDKDEVWFAENQRERKIGHYFPDFTYGKKIIEFYGDVFHANPQLFNQGHKPNPYSEKTSSEIWKHDEKRLNTFRKRGYEILIIWEKDYKENKNKAIKKCLKFLNIEVDYEEKETGS